MKRMFTVLLLSCSLTFAAEQMGRSDSVKYQFNPIVVTATKVAGAQRDIAASVSVVSEKEINRSTTFSALELVKNRVPGVFMTERAMMGYGVATNAAGGLSIRGVGGSPVTGVLVLRDGRPDIMGLMGHAIPDAYALDGVERIEVIRGPGSFLYGTNAMGGVINIVSKKYRRDGFETRIKGSLGSYDTQNIFASHGGKKHKFDYHVTAARRQTDGHRAESNYESEIFTAHVGYALARQTSLEINANYAAIDLLDPGPTFNPVIENWYDLQRSGVDLTLNHSSRFGDTYVKWHGNFGNHKIYDGFRSNDHTIGMMLYHNARPWKGQTLTFGFDVKNYGGDAKNIKRDMLIGDFNMTETAPYIHLQQLFAQKVVASAGLRVENHELFGNEVLPKAGLVFHARPSTSVRFSAAKGFRSPSIRELYLFPPANPELLPERLWNFETGITQQIGKNARLDAVLFSSQGEDMIRLKGRFPEVSWVNSAEFTHTGYEITFDWQITSAFDVNLGWTKLDLGDETRGTPGKKLTLNTYYDFGRVGLAVNLLAAQDLYGADFHQNSLPDYILLNSRTDIKINQWLSLGLQAKNILDKDYQTLYGYPMPGRTAQADVNFAF